MFQVPRLTPRLTGAGLVVLLVASTVAWVAPAGAQETSPDASRSGAGSYVLGLEISESYHNKITVRRPRAGGFSLALRGGYRWETFGGFLLAELIGWEGTYVGEEHFELAADVGIGGEMVYWDRRIRTALIAGTSVLLRENPIDPAGEVGFFVDLRPAGLRFAVGDTFSVILEPVTLTMILPVLSGIPMIVIQYRTVVSFEGWL